MFPYFGLVTLPIFCDFDWPKALYKKYLTKKCFSHKKSLKSIETCFCLNQKPSKIKESPKAEKSNTSNSNKLKEPKKDGNKSITNKSVRHKATPKQKLTVTLILIYCVIQATLPYSHPLTKGYNNWTNGLYGYSWDMMIHSWDTIIIVVKIVDNKSGVEHFLDPRAWVQNDRWTKHADMCMQYAQCLKRNLLEEYEYEKLQYNKESSSGITEFITSDDISIYIDVWCSLNGRFQQRMFDPTYDLLKANWSPFKPIEWSLPLLSQYSEYRRNITEIQEYVYSWSNYSDVMFIADFPGKRYEFNLIL